MMLIVLSALLGLMLFDLVVDRHPRREDDGLAWVGWGLAIVGITTALVLLTLVHEGVLR
jgi:hypothetical protein